MTPIIVFFLILIVQLCVFPPKVAEKLYNESPVRHVLCVVLFGVYIIVLYSALIAEFVVAISIYFRIGISFRAFALFMLIAEALNFLLTLFVTNIVISVLKGEKVDKKFWRSDNFPTALVFTILTFLNAALPLSLYALISTGY